MVLVLWRVVRQWWEILIWREIISTHCKRLSGPWPVPNELTVDQQNQLKRRPISVWTVLTRQQWCHSCYSPWSGITSGDWTATGGFAGPRSKGGWNRRRRASAGTWAGARRPRSDLSSCGGVLPFACRDSLSTSAAREKRRLRKTVYFRTFFPELTIKTNITRRNFSFRKRTIKAL